MNFDVWHDPCRDVPRAESVARNDPVMRAFELAKPIYDAGERLAAMDERVSEVLSMLKTWDGNAAMTDSLQAAAEALAEQIEEVEEAFGRANLLGRATRGTENGSGAPTNDQMWAIETMWAEVLAVIERINELLTTRMPAIEQRLATAGCGRPSASRSRCRAGAEARGPASARGPM